jgi:hypothetical protein
MFFAESHGKIEVYGGSRFVLARSARTLLLWLADKCSVSQKVNPSKPGREVVGRQRPHPRLRHDASIQASVNPHQIHFRNL